MHCLNKNSNKRTIDHLLNVGGIYISKDAKERTAQIKTFIRHFIRTYGVMENE